MPRREEKGKARRDPEEDVGEAAVVGHRAAATVGNGRCHGSAGSAGGACGAGDSNPCPPRAWRRVGGLGNPSSSNGGRSQSSDRACAWTRGAACGHGLDAELSADAHARG